MRYAKRYTNASNTKVKDNLLRTGTTNSNYGKIINVDPDIFRDANLMAEIDPETGKLHEAHLPEMVATVDTTSNVISIKKNGEVIVIPVVYKDPESGKIEGSVLPENIVYTDNEGKISTESLPESVVTTTDGKIPDELLPNSAVDTKEYKTFIETAQETDLIIADNSQRYIELSENNSVYAVEMLLTAVKTDLTENNMVTFKCNFSALTDSAGTISISDAIFEIASNIGSLSFIGNSLPSVSLSENKIYIRVLPNTPSVWYTSIKIIKVNY